jgi:hypothetical protein
MSVVGMFRQQPSEASRGAEVNASDKACDMVYMLSPTGNGDWKENCLNTDSKEGTIAPVSSPKSSSIRTAIFTVRL